MSNRESSRRLATASLLTIPGLISDHLPKLNAPLEPLEPLWSRRAGASAPWACEDLQELKSALSTVQLSMPPDDSVKPARKSQGACYEYLHDEGRERHYYSGR
jgi:hypothetical protein